MKLSARGKYALRLMLALSRKKDPKVPVHLSELAKTTGISKKFLEQLVMGLKSHSLLRGFAGRNGGYILARPADQITIGQVLSASMGPICLSLCVEDATSCINADFCECRLVWMLMNKRIHAILDEYTLADLNDKKFMKSVRKQVEAM